MVNSYLGTRSPKGNVGVRGVVDSGELSAFTRGVLSGFAGNSVTASWTLNVGGISGTQDVAVAKNPSGESDLLVGTAGQSIAFTIGGAPGTPGQSRTDALVAYKDPFVTSVDNDGIDAVDYEVVPGTAATTGTQVPPNDATITAACPTGAFITIIGYVTVAQGASSITTANFVRSLSAMRVSPLVIANVAERNALTPYEGMEIWQADIDADLIYLGSRWRWAESIHRLANVTGSDTAAGGVTNAYATYATSGSITTLGGKVEATISGIFQNASSGADRTADFKVQCDGVDVGTAYTSFVVMLSGTPHVFFQLRVEHTPSAGAHTYTLQAKASANTSVTLRRPTIVVNELAA